ncbi:hypothetical protein [Paraburkholderia kirstenboschensis]|uniref:Uncharacterized protein n=1 Tax=Paraburkholderia kirstenboschensis TaxID=1245436 RepID=A0ABZ0E816_9BURK|nr:hypothetical protein [Paraburkholderia kirstenboschensis]WOD13413.1 hypothetical protein RW095_05070 [Paraburkholderia kirstenboschensis]
MSEHDRLLRANLGERLLYHLSLGRRSLQPVAWPPAESKAGAVKRDRAVALSQPVDQSAGEEVLQQHGVPMQEHNGGAFALVQVMNRYSVDFDKTSGWRVIAFGLAGTTPNP